MILPENNRPDFIDSIQDTTLRQIAEKVGRSIPVDASDANYMLTTPHILDLGSIAHFLRTRIHGNTAYYGVNMNLNYTNICELRCPLCAYSRDEGDADSFLLTIEEIEKRVRNAVDSGIDEIHIVGGLHPRLTLDYFETMLRCIKRIKPDMFIVAFTAVEYDYFAKLNHLPLEDVFRRLIDAGVDALPGGGAEIFAPHVRDVIAPKKISGERWLQVMRTAHHMGLQTNATMLYNHREKPEDVVDHLFRIRHLQDKTGGFKTFVPLLFHEENTQISANRRTTTGYDDIRLYATSRIVLHNIPHLKALWMYLGEKMAQVLLRFGVDDIGATYNNEKVVHAAGATTSDFGSETFLKRLIEEAHLIPKRTHCRISIQPEGHIMRLGYIDYLNCYPFYYHLFEKASIPGVEVVPGYPSDLNRMMVSGELDMSPISAASCVQLDGNIVLLPEFCLSSMGYVGSVVLRSRVPIEDLGGKTVGITLASHTSVILLKMLLQKYYGIKPNYRVTSPNPAFSELDAALLIGNEAMIGSREPISYSYDLGELWLRKTGYPVVFAVFAVRNTASEVHRKQIQATIDSYHLSLACLRNEETNGHRQSTAAIPRYCIRY